MGCCGKATGEKVYKYKMLKIKEEMVIDQNKFRQEIALRHIEDKKVREAYLKEYVDARINKITTLLEDITPFLSKESEDNELDCLECMEKHLSKAEGYIEESATGEYRFNKFRAVGQLGLAEAHATRHPEIREYIRTARINYQRFEKAIDWSTIIKMIDDADEQLTHVI